MRILFVAPPVGPLGGGEGGGTETKLMNLLPELVRRGHQVGLVAAAGSVSPSEAVTMYEVSGILPAYATTAPADAQPRVNTDGLLEHMWEVAAREQIHYDVIVGMCHDWLAYYLTPFFRTPVGHVINVSATINEVNAIILERAQAQPERFAVVSRAQANTFGFANPEHLTVLYNGINLTKYQFTPDPQKRLAWAGRISPEKGLEDALLVAQTLGLPIDVCGKVQNEAYWNQLRQQYAKVELVYHGFLTQDKLHQVVRQAMALLMTPHWVEAFPNVCIEALAAGTPVVAYNYGGPAEIIEDGISGYLVPFGNTEALIAAAHRVPELDRAKARTRVEMFSLSRMADAYEAWLSRLVAAQPT